MPGTATRVSPAYNRGAIPEFLEILRILRRHGAGETVHVLGLETLIETKQETGREQDLAVLPILRRTLEEKRRK